MTLGVLLFVAVLVVLRDHRRLQAFTYTSGFAAIVLLLLPLLPVLGTEINGARIWINVGAAQLPARRDRQGLLVIFFAGYLVLHRDALALAGRRFLGIDLPRGRDLGPDPRRCGWSASASWSSSATSAHRCSSSACSW